MSKDESKGPPDVEQTAKELLKRPGVRGYLVFNDTGIPVKWSSTGLSLNQGGPPGHSSTPIPADVIHHAALISDLCTKARSTCSRLFSDEDPDASALKYIRMRTKENEFIVAPGDGVTLVVVQTPHKKEEVAEAKKEEE